MDDIDVVPRYAAEDVLRAAQAYASARTRVWNGVCLYRHRTDLEFGDECEEREAILEVCELLACPTEYARAVLMLLKGSGRQIVIAEVEFAVDADDDDCYEDEEEDDEDDEDDERPFASKRRGSLRPRSVYEHAYLLSHRGFRKQIRTVSVDGGKRCAMPLWERASTAQCAVGTAQRYRGTMVRQARFLANLQVHYLVTLSPR